MWGHLKGSWGVLVWTLLWDGGGIEGVPSKFLIVVSFLLQTRQAQESIRRP